MKHETRRHSLSRTNEQAVLLLPRWVVCFPTLPEHMISLHRKKELSYILTTNEKTGYAKLESLDRNTGKVEHLVTFTTVTMLYKNFWKWAQCKQADVLYNA